MIRDIRRNGAQPKDTMHKAEVAMVTGMGVVIKDASTVKLPAAETASNIYVATQERVTSSVLKIIQMVRNSLLTSLKQKTLNLYLMEWLYL